MTFYSTLPVLWGTIVICTSSAFPVTGDFFLARVMNRWEENVEETEPECYLSLYSGTGTEIWGQSNNRVLTLIRPECVS